MDTTVIVAITGGVFGVAVAVISSIVALISTRRAAQATKELEEYKSRLESTKEKDQRAFKLMENRIEVLRNYCKEIQQLRDHIRSLEHDNAQESSVHKQIIDGCDTISNMYRVHHGMLGNSLRSTMHDLNHVLNALSASSQFCLINIKRKQDYQRQTEYILSCLKPLTDVQRSLLETHDDFLYLLTGSVDDLRYLSKARTSSPTTQR